MAVDILTLTYKHKLFSMNVGHIYTKKSFVVYLRLKCHWETCILSGNPSLGCLRSSKRPVWPEWRQQGEDGGRWRRGKLAEGSVVEISYPEKPSRYASRFSSAIFSRQFMRKTCAKSCERGDGRERVAGGINLAWVIKTLMSAAPVLQRRWNPGKPPASTWCWSFTQHRSWIPSRLTEGDGIGCEPGAQRWSRRRSGASTPPLMMGGEVELQVSQASWAPGGCEQPGVEHLPWAGAADLGIWAGRKPLGLSWAVSIKAEKQKTPFEVNM